MSLVRMSRPPRRRRPPPGAPVPLPPGRASALLALAGLAALAPSPVAWLQPARGVAPQSVARRAEARAAQVADLKASLLNLCDSFKGKQEEMWDAMDQESAELAKAGKAKKASGPSLLEAESFASQQTALGEELAELRNQTVEVISLLAAQNPTDQPNAGWRGFAGGRPTDCPLNGTWKLIFTDAADATFKKGRRGAANTFQEVDADGGWFVNCVDFSSEDSKLRGFRVFVEGDALSSTEMQLSFRKVRLLRRSRFPRLFGEITIPLPSPKLIRSIGTVFARAMGGKVNPSDRGAGFTMLYVDEDLRMHQTFDGLFFVQKRLA